MRDDSRAPGLVAAAAAIGVGLFAPWWRVAAFGLSVSVDLHDVRSCIGVDCHEEPLPGTFASTAALVFWLGVVAILFSLAVAFTIWTRREISHRLIRLTPIAGGVVLAGAVLGWGTLSPRPDFGDASWGLGLTLLGGVALIMLGLRTRDEAPLETSILREARQSAPQAPASPAVASRALEYQRAIDHASRPTARGLAQTSSGVAADRAAETVRFVVRAARFDERVLAGDDRELAWTDVGRIVARRLPPDPPFEKLLVVDFVPQSGAPLRLTISTKVDYTKLPGGAASTARQNLRKLVAFARTRHPAVELDDGAEMFVTGGEPPILGSPRQLAELEATYVA